MKNLLLIVVAASTFAIAGAIPARAQVIDAIVADIPFGFTVSNITLPAGEYTITRLDSIDPNVMEISGENAHERLVFLVGSAETLKRSDKTQLIFDRVGDQYFLSEIFEEGNSTGVELKKSHAERELEKEGVMTRLDLVAIPAKTSVQASR